MKESVDRIPWYFLNLTILRTSPRRMLAFLGETTVIDLIELLVHNKMLQTIIKEFFVRQPLFVQERPSEDRTEALKSFEKLSFSQENQ